VDDRDAMEGRIIDGRYRIVSLLERGGTGSIYVADQIRVARQVAIKVLRASLAGEGAVSQRFAREAEVISQLEHPNTLKLFDFGWLDDGRPYLVTELLHGETLAHRLERGRMSVGEAARVTQAILRSLDEAHEKGIVHRDLKPSNVFLQDDRGATRVRVLDFGIARLATSSTLTEPGMIMGTPAYMSPEQSLKDSVDGRSDIYSVGAILFECLTGRTPFLAQNAQTLILKHALMQAPRLNQVSSGFPDTVDDLVARMLSKTVELRPQACAEVIRELEPYVSSRTVAPEPRRDESLEAAFAPEVVTPLEQEALQLPRRSRFNGAPILAALGILLMVAAGVSAMTRTLMPGRLDVSRAAAPPPPEPLVPAIPAPVIVPSGPPAPFTSEWLEDQAASEPGPEPSPHRSPRRRRRAPPGFVDVDL
jgi:serine/threonine-protein kinase